MSRVRSAEQGLYRSEYEHDACGVAFVARLDAQPLHETVRRALAGPRQPRASRRRGRRSEHRRRRRHPDADPRRVLPRRRRGGAARGRPLRRRDVLLPPRGRAPAASSSSCSRRSSRTRARASSAGATSRSTRRSRAALRRRPHRSSGSSSSPPSDAPRRPGRVRAQALRDPPPVRARGRRRRDHPELLLPHDRLQGDADRAAAPRLLPRPAGRAHRDRRSRSSTRGSRRTRSRAGSSPTRTG